MFAMIQNDGVGPASAFMVLGAGTKNGDNLPKGTIGMFGSGGNMATLVLLRQGLSPRIFLGGESLEFGTEPMEVRGVDGTTWHRQVHVHRKGKTADGRTINRKEKLSWTTAYGANDWTDVALAMREYVSNAIDACLAQGVPLAEVGKHVVVEMVEDNQVRAKAGHTRVFVPANDQVRHFMWNLHNWFLHFREPEMLQQTILPKKGRNLTDKGGVPSRRAVIYRRGVRVREFTYDDTPSLYDYNLDDLQLNESRTVDDWAVWTAAGRAIKRAGPEVLAQVLRAMSRKEKVWETRLPDYTFESRWDDDAESIASNWKKAIEVVGGEDAVLVSQDSLHTADIVEKKGFFPLMVPSGVMTAARSFHLPSADKVLSEDDKAGRTYSPATEAVLDVFEWVWEVATLMGVTDGKGKPVVDCFYEPMRAESQTLGLYRDGRVSIHTDIAQEPTDMLRWVMWEEVGHYLTGAADLSRDFQTFFIRLVAALASNAFATV